MAKLYLAMLLKPSGSGFHTMWENLNTICQSCRQTVGCL